jgi:hypothetical protein
MPYELKKCVECGAEFIGPDAELALREHTKVSCGIPRLGRPKEEMVLQNLVSKILEEITSKQAEIELLTRKKSILQEALYQLKQTRENKANAV